MTASSTARELDRRTAGPANGGAVRADVGGEAPAGPQGRPLELLEPGLRSERPDGWGTRYGLGKRPDRVKADRWRELEYLRDFSARKGARTCMMPSGDVVDIAVTLDGKAHLSGVMRCASATACPVCTPVIRQRRAMEIELALQRWRAQGKAAVMVTATIPHESRHSLETVLDVLQKAWRSMFKDRRGQKLRKQLGIVHSIRVIELTWGYENGWHPHVHAVFFLDADEEGFDVEPVRFDLASRWRELVGLQEWTGTAGQVGRWRVPTWAHGMDVKLVDSVEVIAEYITKVEYKQGCKIPKGRLGTWGAAQELALADRKAAGPGRFTPWDILRSAAQGDAEMSQLYREFESATAGKQLIQWSKGAKADLCVEEVSDVEAATVDPATEVWSELQISGREWVEMMRSGGAEAFLDQIEILTLTLLGLSAALGHPPPKTQTFEQIADRKAAAFAAELDEITLPAETALDVALASVRSHLRSEFETR